MKILFAIKIFWRIPPLMNSPLSAAHNNETYVFTIKIYPSGSCHENRDHVIICCSRAKQQGLKGDLPYVCRFRMRTHSNRPTDIPLVEHSQPKHSEYVAYVKCDDVLLRSKTDEAVILTIDIEVPVHLLF